MNAMDTSNAARGRWPGILSALGVMPDYLKNEHGPCPLGCAGKKSWRFDDKLNGSWICTHCGAGDGFLLLQKLHGWSFKKAASEVDRVVGNVPISSEAPEDRSDHDKMLACRKLLAGAGRVVPGTPAHAYLLSRCGEFGPFHGDLWAHPGIRHSNSGGIHPALLAVLKYPDGSGCSVHRTYLTPDGHKAIVDPVRKMMPGLSLPGSSVRLGPAMERMGIAEGIETALCASRLFHIPVWSATNANQLIAWDPPEGVKSLVIFGDNDESYTGQAAAFALAKRLRSKGIAVEIQIPPSVGTDWADVAQERMVA